MNQKVINKVYFVSVIKDRKVIDIIRGKILEDIIYRCRSRYPNCEVQTMEYNDEYNVYVPDIEDHLMMIRRRHANGILK